MLWTKNSKWEIWHSFDNTVLGTAYKLFKFEVFNPTVLESNFIPFDANPPSVIVRKITLSIFTRSFSRKTD